MMILMLLFSKKGKILMSISLLTAAYDDTEASIMEGVKDSN